MDWRVGLGACGAVGFAVQVLYAASFHGFARFARVLSGSAAVGVAAVLAGVLVGFLFGIPRASTQREAGNDGEAYLANTNLEQISDWLTKILVGVGLIQIGRAPDSLARLARSLSPVFGDRSDSAGFALATVVLFAIGGFLWSYLWARLHLLRDFSEASRVTRRLVAQTDRDTTAFTLASRQLSEGLPPGERDTLPGALREASPLAAIQIFQLATNQRERSWRTDQASLTRTIPVLQALTDRDDAGEHHEWHARLGYAMSDLRPLDRGHLDAAITELGEAIDIRHRAQQPPGAFYHWNRAKCRVLLERHLSAAADVTETLRDLRIAGERGMGERWFGIDTQDASQIAVGEWLDAHGGRSAFWAGQDAAGGGRLVGGQA